MAPTRRRAGRASLSAAVALALLLPAGCKEDDGPPLAGGCGLAGQRVWCNTDQECREHNVGGIGNYCNIYGECYLDQVGTVSCDPAMPRCEGYMEWVCQPATNRCAKPCRPHEDCPGGMCFCVMGVMACHYTHCQNGVQEDGVWRCPTGSTPVEGTLRCVPTDPQGVCHGANSQCPDGFQPVGTHGCEPLFDCGDGVRESGEDCDGTDLGDATCESIGIDWGLDGLACAPDCGFVVSGCFDY